MCFGLVLDPPINRIAFSRLFLKIYLFPSLSLFSYTDVRTHFQHRFINVQPPFACLIRLNFISINSNLPQNFASKNSIDRTTIKNRDRLHGHVCFTVTNSKWRSATIARTVTAVLRRMQRSIEIAIHEQIRGSLTVSVAPTLKSFQYVSPPSVSQQQDRSICCDLIVTLVHTNAPSSSS